MSGIKEKNEKTFKNIKNWALSYKEKGAIEAVVAEVIIGIIGLIIIGSVIVGMWPNAEANNASVAALTQTDVATTILKAIWPFLLLALVAGIVISLLVHYFRGHNS